MRRRYSYRTQSLSDEIYFIRCATVFCWYFKSDNQASIALLFQTVSNPTGENVELRTWCRIVSFQYVLCDKVTDRSGPEIYVYLFTTNEQTTSSCSQKFMLISVLLFNWLNSTEYDLMTNSVKWSLCNKRLLHCQKVTVVFVTRLLQSIYLINRLKVKASA